MQPDTLLKGLALKVEMPVEAMRAMWLDGLRTGLLLGLAAGALAAYWYLTGRK